MSTSTKTYSVRAFGASGDGVHKDTFFIQQAINQCHHNNGGIVRMESGRYLTGSLELKSNVTLQIDKDAVLVASPLQNDYVSFKASTDCLQQTNRCGLIYASGQKNIALTGEGKIIGQDQEFWIPMKPEEIGESWNTIPPRYHAKSWRPMLVIFDQCRKVHLDKVTFENAPAYAGWLINSEEIIISNVQVTNDFYGPNTDGFHLSSCRNVHISHCHFITGDDSIAVDGNGAYPAENIRIHHCSFNTSVNALRIYTGLDADMKSLRHYPGIVRNLVMTDCKIINAAGVINITAQTGLIENISCSHLTIEMQQEGTVFFLMNMEGMIRNIQFKNITAKSNGAATILGVPQHYLESIQLDDIHFQITPKKKWHGLEMPDPVPSYGHHHFAPFSIYIRYIRNIQIRNVIFEWVHVNPDIVTSDSPVKCRHVDNIQIMNFTGTPINSQPITPVIDLVDVTNHRIS